MSLARDRYCRRRQPIPPPIPFHPAARSTAAQPRALPGLRSSAASELFPKLLSTNRIASTCYLSAPPGASSPTITPPSPTAAVTTHPIPQQLKCPSPSAVVSGRREEYGFGKDLFRIDLTYFLESGSRAAWGSWYGGHDQPLCADRYRGPRSSAPGGQGRREPPNRCRS